MKMNGTSFDIVSDNISKLKEIFPEVISEDKIDFDKLKLILGENVALDKERFSFDWPGKNDAIKESQKTTTGTLRPCKEESKNWDTTENLYIEGDNLEVLKILQKSYNGKIKAIYIDPPYNTGKDFIFPDDYSDNLMNYLKRIGQISERESLGVKLTNNPETSGRFHSNWLNMMYPRLKLARNLLTDDGVIFISISEEELYNLIKICNEIFGEENYRNMIAVRRHDKNLNRQFIDEGLKSMNVGLEFILIYTKNIDTKLKPVFRKASYERSKKGYWKGFWNNADRPTMRYDILGVTPAEGQWKWKKDVAYEAIKNYEYYLENHSENCSLEEYWNKTGKNKLFIRRNLKGKGKNKGVEHWIPPNDKILRNSNWSDFLISKNNDVGVPFDNPKNFEVILELIELANCNNDIILDFFSGSSTTAEAVLKNENYNKFIMVQIPEVLNEKSKDFEEEYKNICEIGKERIRRVGDKILEESNNDDLDIGFKVFKLDSSNLEKWDPDYDDIQQSLIVDNIKEDRSNEDLIYEIMLKTGLDLTAPIKEIEGMYLVMNSLLIYLENEIADDLEEKIIELNEQYNILRVVFKDSAFKKDYDKTNLKESLKMCGIDEFITI